MGGVDPPAAVPVDDPVPVVPVDELPVLVLVLVLVDDDEMGCVVPVLLVGDVDVEPPGG